MANPKLFVSLPMRGYDDDDIRAEMAAVKEFAENECNQELDLINSLEEDVLPDEVLHDNYYLGKSIQKLSTADICVFHPDWKSAPGCIIEHMVCAMYDIPYVEIRNQDLGLDEDDMLDE